MYYLSLRHLEYFHLSRGNLSFSLMEAGIRLKRFPWHEEGFTDEKPEMIRYT